MRQSLRRLAPKETLIKKPSTAERSSLKGPVLPAPASTLALSYEQKVLAQTSGGPAVVIGVDEAGRGPLAGPVVAAAVAVLGPLQTVPVVGVNDSKTIDEDTRERLFEELTSHERILHAVSTVDHATIDKINILQATFRAMDSAARELKDKLTARGVIAAIHCAVDGPHVPPGLRAAFPSVAGVVGGDAKVYSIAAASLIAKVTRDRLMRAYSKEWPEYSFAKHKGYGVAAHVAAIRQHGPCPIHRRSFEPVKSWYPEPTPAIAELGLPPPASAGGSSKRRRHAQPPAVVLEPAAGKVVPRGRKGGAKDAVSSSAASKLMTRAGAASKATAAVATAAAAAVATAAAKKRRAPQSLEPTAGRR